MNHAELVMRRRNVRAFIKADPVLITVTRPGAITGTAAGGTIRGSATTLDPQQARIVQVKRKFDNGLQNVEPGYIPSTEYSLVAEYMRDFKVDDQFSWAGNTWAITGVHPTRTESILCSIDFLGPPNG